MDDSLDALVAELESTLETPSVGPAPQVPTVEAPDVTSVMPDVGMPPGFQPEPPAEATQPEAEVPTGWEAAALPGVLEAAVPTAPAPVQPPPVPPRPMASAAAMPPTALAPDEPLQPAPVFEPPAAPVPAEQQVEPFIPSPPTTVSGTLAAEPAPVTGPPPAFEPGIAPPAATPPPATAAAEPAAEPSAPKPSVPEYQMVAPVELRFGDKAQRVGIRPGTATFLKFQRLAAVLLTDLRKVKGVPGGE